MDKRRLLLGGAFYAANVVATFCLIAFADLPESVRIALAVWLVVLTALLSYAAAVARRKGRGR